MDKTLTQCSRQSILTRFVLKAVGYDIQFESQLTRYAINRNVQEIDLSFGAITEAPFLLDQLIFTNSCFTHLNFDSCRLTPTSAVNWNNLKSCISHGKLDEDLIQSILCGSPLLETFKLFYCYGFRRLVITSKSVKNLLFSGYFGPESYNHKHVIDIEINAPYISSLTIRGMLALRKLLLLNLTSLIEANLSFWKGRLGMNSEEEMLSHLVLNLRHVKELNFGNDCLEAPILFLISFHWYILSRLEAKGFTFPSDVNYLDYW